MQHPHPPPKEVDWTKYDTDNASITLHLPESVDECLVELTERFEQTKSDLARNALMLHVHGRLQFERLVAQKLWRLRRRVEAEEIRRFNLQGYPTNISDSPRKEFIAAFGKSTAEVKIWLPRPLLDEISELALNAEMSPSEYARRALTAYYLGRTKIDALRPQK
jgi:predicted transcriptional regulator